MIIDRASTEELRKLTARLIEGQEAERSRLARELHDDVSQRLALLAVNLRLLERSVPNATAGVQASIGDLYSEVQALGRDVRRMSHALHPARLEQVGLVSALRGLCADMSAAYGITITFDADGSQDVPSAVALCLYRVAQEALQNVVKHSGATRAAVELTGSDRDMRLVISDDGCGFDTAATRRGDSLGLASMRERVSAVHGRLSIQGRPGQGTRVELRVLPSGDFGDGSRTSPPLG